LLLLLLLLLLPQQAQQRPSLSARCPGGCASLLPALLLQEGGQDGGQSAPPSGSPQVHLLYRPGHYDVMYPF
jgi:hypothetical protein